MKKTAYWLARLLVQEKDFKKAWRYLKHFQQLLKSYHTRHLKNFWTCAEILFSLNLDLHFLYKVSLNSSGISNFINYSLQKLCSEHKWKPRYPLTDLNTLTVPLLSFKCFTPLLVLPLTQRQLQSTLTSVNWMRRCLWTTVFSVYCTCSWSGWEKKCYILRLRRKLTLSFCLSRQPLKPLGHYMKTDSHFNTSL